MANRRRLIPSLGEKFELQGVGLLEEVDGQGQQFGGLAKGR